MVNKSVPEIEVGIMKAARIRFKLEGDFLHERDGSVIAGEGEAEIGREGINLSCGDSQFTSSDAILLIPLQGDKSRFILHEVVIGIGFHWEQKEDQEFQGSLKLLVLEGD